MPCLANASRTSRSPLPYGRRRTARRCDKVCRKDGHVRADVLPRKKHSSDWRAGDPSAEAAGDENSKHKRLVADSDVGPLDAARRAQTKVVSPSFAVKSPVICSGLRHQRASGLPGHPRRPQLTAIDVIDVFLRLVSSCVRCRAYSFGQLPGVHRQVGVAWITGSCQDGYITPGPPWENGYVESFNARLWDELLNGAIFYTLREPQIVIESWRRHYNAVRPHGSLDTAHQPRGVRASLHRLVRCAPRSAPPIKLPVVVPAYRALTLIWTTS